MLEAGGECDPLEASKQCELQTCGALDDHNSYGDMERSVVFEWSCALLEAWKGLACKAAMIKLSLRCTVRCFRRMMQCHRNVLLCETVLLCSFGLLFPLYNRQE